MWGLMASPSLDDLTDIAISFNEAVLNQDMWEPSLQKMANLFGGSFATFELIDKRHGHSIQHFDSSEIEIKDSYIQHYMPINPRIAFGNRAGAPQIMHDNIFMAEKEMDHHEFYADFLRPFDLRYFIALKAFETKGKVGIISVQKSARNGVATKDELRAFEYIAPSLKSTVKLHVQHGKMLTRMQGFENAFEISDRGILLLNEDGQINEMNATAISIFRKNDGLTYAKGRLHCSSAQIGKKLDSALRQDDSDDFHKHRAQNFLIPRPSGDAPYQISIQPITAHQENRRQSGNGFMILITDPTHSHTLEINELMDGFGLTTAEANVALMIANGKTAQEITAELCVALPTIRTHIQRVMQKMSINRQIDIARILTRYM